MMAQGYPRESKSLVALYRARIEDRIALYCLLLDAHLTPRIMLSVPSRITQIPLMFIIQVSHARASVRPFRVHSAFFYRFLPTAHMLYLNPVTIASGVIQVLIRTRSGRRCP